MPTTDESSLTELLDALPLHHPDHSFGADIDEAHRVLLADNDPAVRERTLRSWLRHWQPCVFGKAVATDERALPVGIVTPEDIRKGATQVRYRLQEIRHAWKTQAATGATSSVQILFLDPRLARAAPSPELLAALRVLCGLYLVERAPIELDTIYLESVPLARKDGGMEMFVANVTLFFPGAHRTRMHDHRAPGGLLMNINAIGHHVHAQLDDGRFSDEVDAVDWARRTALRSVGNGGLAHPDRHGSTWHCRRDQQTGYGMVAPRPGFIPDDVDPTRYGSLYHIDVTVPTVFGDASEPAAPLETEDYWPMMLDYLTTERVPGYHHAAIMRGCPVHEQWWDANLWPQTMRTWQSKVF